MKFIRTASRQNPGYTVKKTDENKSALFIAC